MSGDVAAAAAASTRRAKCARGRWHGRGRSSGSIGLPWRAASHPPGGAGGGGRDRSHRRTRTSLVAPRTARKSRRRVRRAHGRVRSQQASSRSATPAGRPASLLCQSSFGSGGRQSFPAPRRTREISCRTRVTHRQATRKSDSRHSHRGDHSAYQMHRSGATKLPHHARGLSFVDWSRAPQGERTICALSGGLHGSE